MARWISTAAVVIGALAVASAAVGIGRLAWHRAIDDAVRRLRAEAQPIAGQALPAEALAQLPAPVARYFAFALPDGQPPIRAARIEWRGGFRTAPDAAWAPFTAEQHFTVYPPGFVWDTQIHMLPLIPVHIRDSYVARTATMRGRLGGVVTVVDEGGTPEIAESALGRWLGEAAWFPTALLPGGAVEWEAIDDRTARATVRDGEVRASADFHFAPTGEITRVTMLRYRDVDGTAVLTPFEGEYAAYERRNGVMIPTRAEVAWLLPEGRFAYWRARPERIEYETDATGR